MTPRTPSAGVEPVGDRAAEADGDRATHRVPVRRVDHRDVDRPDRDAGERTGERRRSARNISTESLRAIAADRARRPALLESPPASTVASDATTRIRAYRSVTWLGHATAVAELGRGSRACSTRCSAWRARRGRQGRRRPGHALARRPPEPLEPQGDRSRHPPGRAQGREAHRHRSRVREGHRDDRRRPARDRRRSRSTAVATRHDNGRWRKGDAPDRARLRRRQAAASRVHHAGDVDFSDHAVFDDIGKRFAIDATLLPIGGMMPVWYYRARRHLIDRGVHIDPDCALDIYERLGAQDAGAGALGHRCTCGSDCRAMPRRRLAKIAAERDMRRACEILAHGERLALRHDSRGTVGSRARR